MWNFHYFRRGADSDLYCKLMAKFGCAKGYPARSIWHGCGIKSEWLAQNDDREGITKMAGELKPL